MAVSQGIESVNLNPQVVMVTGNFLERIFIDRNSPKDTAP